MKFKEYIEIAQEMIKENPTLGEMEIVYASDDEGNSYQKVGYSPSISYLDNDMKAYAEEDVINGEVEQEDITEYICLN